MHEPLDAFVGRKEIPLVRIPMLKHGSPLEIMLEHRAFQRTHRGWWHRKRLTHSPKGKVEGVLVPVHELIEEIRLLVEPQGQTQRLPASSLVNHDLTALEGRRIRRKRNPAQLPDRGL